MTIRARSILTAILLFGATVILVWVFDEPIWWGLVGGGFLSASYIALVGQARKAEWLKVDEASPRFDLSTLGCLFAGVLIVILVAIGIAWLLAL